MNRLDFFGCRTSREQSTPSQRERADLAAAARLARVGRKSTCETSASVVRGAGISFGLLAELLAEGQDRGEVDKAVDPGFAALTVTAARCSRPCRAAAAGPEPGIGIGPALDLLWSGIG